MTTAAIRKKCMEVSGGRRSYQAEYQMPGLAMQIYSRPSHDCCQGGGEVHYISSCASGRITRIMLADIVGSEDVFKRLSCEIRSGLLRNINSIWQNRVVSEMGEQLRQFAAQGGFATAAVATFFAPTRSFAMCNIGNPPPLVFSARNRSWQVLHGQTDRPSGDGESADGTSVDGVFDADEYRYVNTKLDVGDVIVLYGNGFAQSAFPNGSLVGHQRLIEALQDSPHSNPSTRLEHLIHLIQDHNPSREDNTIIVCRVTKTGVRWRDNLLAPLRLLRRPSEDTVLS